MAFVLPIISAVSTVAAAGSVAAAVSTVGGFLSVAGGVLAGVGALTGKKDLVKLGGLFSLGSAVSGSLGFGGTSTGIGGAAEAASGAAETAGQGMQLTGGAAEGLKPSIMSEGIKGFGDSAAMRPVDYSLGASSAAAPAGGQGLMAQGLAQAAAQPSSLVQQAGAMTAQAPVGGAVTQPAADYSLATGVGGAKPLPAAAAGITQSDINSVLAKGWERAQAMLKNTGQFIKDNKELAQIGGTALANMYGPQAEQMDYQRSLMDQVRRNLNSPVRLGMTTPGG